MAAAWGLLDELGVIGIIDEAAGRRPAGQPLSTGAYLALAALNRLVAPCSKAGFADWWKTTAADRFTKIPASALDHRRFWDAMHAVALDHMEQASRAIAARIVQVSGVDCSSVALDMTNFARTLADAARFGQLTAHDTRREVYGAERRAILTHSPELRDSQVRGFDGTTLAKAGKKLDELASTLARGKTRRRRDKVQAEIEAITAKPRVPRVIRWQLAGDQPKDLRLSWTIDQEARAALEEEIFGKHLLITSHDDWAIPDVVAGYRSQSEAEFGFRQMKDPHVVSFSPMHHWTEHNIRVHLFTCVLALQLAHLMRRRARQAGLNLSVRELLGQLAGIGETVLIYPSTGGRPKARRMTTELTADQQALHDIFRLDRWAPPS